MVSRVTHGDIGLGSYNAMLQIGTDRSQWVDAAELVDVRMQDGPVCMALDFIGRTRAEAYGFEIAHRLTLFPESDWFVAELLWVRNIGKRPLGIRAFFFRFYGAIGGEAKGDVSVRGGVPRLWGRVPGDGWLDEKAGAFWGCVTPRPDRLRVRFWLNEQGGQHPDARWEEEMTLAPGATFRPPEPIYVVALAGRGGREQWERTSRLVHTIALLRVH